MFNFSYLDSTYFLEVFDYKAFWKCDEKIKVSPFSLPQKLLLFSKLHVIYLKILQ